ncbi:MULTISPECIES: DoxX family membrane protein [Streptomyces]|uniref:DoxX family membrane protein n=1 Tax=Streptomyces TaxID=1883 RepID=UPI001E565B96|nr:MULTISPECIES: DoxX family membrane protein [Streptomyces]UFQ20237.1 DoxX family membrane protein [Streptomyces huasconensis]WCL89855.1 DoxX family membrane protein [Streptomyces sp. JCM 35825]
MDTRTPRTPTGGSSSGFDEAPALSMVKVPSDPAQVIVSHASFRVQLPAAGRIQSPRISRHLGLSEETVRIPAVSGAARRRAPVVWSGKSEPGDPGATGLLQAVRGSGVRRSAEEAGPYDDGGATQVIPRVDLDDGPGAARATGTVATPAVGPAAPQTQLLPQMRMPSSDYDERLAEENARYGEYAYDDDYADRPGTGGDADDEAATEERRRRQGADPVRHAYYPGRRMNLGVVLLPLRVFLGFISIYAGMGKLCDPVYFDGGQRGSMVKWLTSLHPWALAEPLRDFALQHPVGAGLSIAFLQVVVGVLTVLGLWQRVAASVGVLLSAALIVTVSWKTVPAYDAPDIIYLAAWSPLIIAGAPVYSVDGRLAGEAWRRLGPRADIWDLRRRVLRRGGLVGAVVIGLTLILGSLLGGAVRDADRVTVPGPGEPPRNVLPGSPLPEDPAKKRREKRSQSPSASAGSESPTQGSGSASPSQGATAPGAVPETGAAGAGQPSQTQGSSTGQAPPQQSAPQRQQQQQQPPAASTAGPSSSGGGTGGGTGGSGGSGGSGGAEEPGGLLGGVLGN